GPRQVPFPSWIGYDPAVLAGRLAAKYAPPDRRFRPPRVYSGQAGPRLTTDKRPRWIFCTKPSVSQTGSTPAKLCQDETVFVARATHQQGCGMPQKSRARALKPSDRPLRLRAASALLARHRQEYCSTWAASPTAHAFAGLDPQVYTRGWPDDKLPRP